MGGRLLVSSFLLLASPSWSACSVLTDFGRFQGPPSDAGVEADAPEGDASQTDAERSEGGTP